MHLSTLVSSPKRLLLLCISSLHSILASVYSKVAQWTTGECKAPTSPAAPAESRQELISDDGSSTTTPTSVNYHFTRKCNYKCGFCFHTAKTSFVLPLEEATRGLQLLKDSGKLDAPRSVIIFLASSGESVRNFCCLSHKNAIIISCGSSSSNIAITECQMFFSILQCYSVL